MSNRDFRLLSWLAAFGIACLVELNRFTVQTSSCGFWATLLAFTLAPALASNKEVLADLRASIEYYREERA
jgi:hypothetical protein